MWEKALSKLWDDPSLSLSGIARKLKCSRSTIKYQAVRLGLKFPRLSPNSKLTQVNSDLKKYFEDRPLKSLQKAKAKSEKMISNRKKFLHVIKQNPKATRSLLAQILPGIYAWLNRNDKEWLIAHLPPPSKRVGSARQVDWASRDASLAEAVQHAALKLKSTEGVPKRVTVTAIGREIDNTGQLRRRDMPNKGGLRN